MHPIDLIDQRELPIADVGMLVAPPVDLLEQFPGPADSASVLRFVQPRLRLIATQASHSNPYCVAAELGLSS